MKSIRLGILGYGTVGQGIKSLLRQHGVEIAQRTGVQFEIVAVGVRDLQRPRQEPCDNLSTDLDSIVGSKDIDLIAEVMGGLDPTTGLVESALKNGKSVATANKAMIASSGPQLLDLARTSGCDLRFEATVCGGIPVVSALQRQLQSNSFRELVGIVNGSTNFILTQMAERGLGMEDAMAEARDRGFLEADPSSDIDGEDAAFKLSILCSIATGKWIDPELVLRSGIRPIDSRDISAAASIGGVYKLVAMAQVAHGRLNVAVRPAIVLPSHPFYEVRNEQNAVSLLAEPVGTLFWRGAGAGAGPTASAVVGDLIELARNPGRPPTWGPDSNLARRPEFESQFAITVEGNDLMVIEKASRALQPISILKNASTATDTVLITERVSSQLLDANLGRLDSVRRVDPILI